MALINRETDYAIRIIRSLSEESVKSVPDICREQDFTESFAYKIIKKLQKAGFVDIIRGKQGGIQRLPETSDKSLYDLMQALDNIQYVNECFKPGYCCEYGGSSFCNAHANLVRLQNRIDSELKSIKISEFY